MAIVLTAYKGRNLCDYCYSSLFETWMYTESCRGDAMCSRYNKSPGTVIGQGLVRVSCHDWLILTDVKRGFGMIG